jgi:hypothetical protein
MSNKRSSRRHCIHTLPTALTPIAPTVDDRLTGLCHTGVDTTVFELVRRISSQGSGHKESATEQSLASAIYGEEHCSYLLRLCRAGGEGSWRASLQSIPSSERHMFADLDSLLAFLFALSQ